jgi:hypothetical protein
VLQRSTLQRDFLSDDTVLKADKLCVPLNARLEGNEAEEKVDIEEQTWTRPPSVMTRLNLLFCVTLEPKVYSCNNP